MQFLKTFKTKNRFWRFYLDVLSGALASFALPPLFILPALFFLAIPVWRVIHTSSRSMAAVTFGAAGFGWFLASTFWVSHALIIEASSLWFLTPLVSLGLALILALFWAVAGAVSWTSRGSATSRLLWLLAAFALSEWSRSFVATGFPWSLMGSVFAIHVSSLQMASVVGVYGLNLLAFGCVIAPLLWILSAYRLAAFFFIIPLVGTAWGVSRLDKSSAALNVPAPIARLVQPAVLQNDKWNPSKRPKHLAKLIELSQTGNRNPDLVIWPETAFAGLLNRDGKLLTDTVNAAIDQNSFLLTGIPRFNTAKKLLNSALLFDHQGIIRGVYDKRHLVPFGEYVPFRTWLSFLDIIAGPADFDSGKENRLISVPNIGQVQILICYEVIFAGRVAESKNRPDLIVNITNDAWFGRTLGPRQHLYQAQMRAVEEGVPLLRAANTGISAAFDGFGRQLDIIPLGQRGYLDISIPSVLTPPQFARFGNTIFFTLCFFIVFIAGFTHARQLWLDRHDP